MLAKDPNAIKFDLPIKELDSLVDDYVRKEADNLGKQMVEQIYKRTKLGFGVEDTGKRIKLDKLSESYRDQRKGKIAFFKKNGITIPVKPNRRPSKLDRSTTTPTRSNLTATGLMLDSLKRIVRGNKIIIYLQNKTGTDLYGRSTSVTTNEKAEFQAKKGRRFLDLAKFEQKLFASIVTKDILNLSKIKLSKFNKP